MSPVLYYALPATGCYIMLSLFFLRRPRLLHRPWVRAFESSLVAHRAGSGEKLESTMEAMENSKAQRADLLELDCHLTRDGVVVVSHDKNLLRQSGLNRDVDSLDFEDLPLYKKKLEIYFSPGEPCAMTGGQTRACVPPPLALDPQGALALVATSHPLFSSGCTPTPWPPSAPMLPCCLFPPPTPGHFATGSDRRMVTLEDVFQRFPRMPMIVEVKEEDEELIHKIADLVRRFDRNEITVWASEKNSVMKKCTAANPEMPFSFTMCRGVWILLLYYLGLLPFISIPERFLLIFLPSIINRTYFPSSSSLLNQLLAVLSKKMIMRKSLIQHLEGRGIQVVFWCLNEESDFEVAFSLGASGVITDYPTALRRYLDNHRAVAGAPHT
ncbi:lysophospholipase D GDPD3 isoform X1 [Tenrec ecaudatus]|uniref:lysophospholipase D GDPD3 isoform X1 n=1 Tax=Tenrec ecaudatus TaxID=94439 RepID=UPI003F59EB1F